MRKIGEVSGGRGAGAAGSLVGESQQRADADGGVASTVISPIVSKPRKSTRMTLTMLRPWPRVEPKSRSTPQRGAVSVVETDSTIRR